MGKLDQGLSDSGDCKNSSKGQKPVQFEAAFSHEYGGQLELGFGQPAVVCTL